MESKKTVTEVTKTVTVREPRIVITLTEEEAADLRDAIAHVSGTQFIDSAKKERNPDPERVSGTVYDFYNALTTAAR